MDRLTTGRRRVRAGSVSVTELITKQAARPESPQGDVDVTADLPIVSGGTPTSHRRPAMHGAQFAKITGLGVATAVLCGAVGIASTIAHQRQVENEAANRPAEPISGEQALLPDELDRTLTRGGAKAVAPPAPDPVTQAPRAEANPPPATTTTTAPATAPADTGAAAPTPVSDLDVVRRFYETVPRDPAVAFGLISPELLHSTLGRFLESWSRVRSVDVLGLQKRADGVLAIIRMQLADGRHIQLQQLLTVADSPRRIVDVELLSAQRN